MNVFKGATVGNHATAMNIYIVESHGLCCGRWPSPGLVGACLIVETLGE